MIVSFIIFAAYWMFIWQRYGIQRSISESFYRLPKNKQWIFTLVLWGFSLPLIIRGVELHPLFFFAGTAICFVGAAPSFQTEGLQRKVHMIGSYAGIISAIIAFALLGEFGIAIAGSVIILALTQVNNKIWWIETAAYLTTLIGLTII